MPQGMHLAHKIRTLVHTHTHTQYVVGCTCVVIKIDVKERRQDGPVM